MKPSRTSGRAWPYRPERRDPAVDAAVPRQGAGAEKLLDLLRDVQASGRPLDDAALGAAADALQLHDARVQGVASFYSLLRSGPARVVRVCDGPVCLLHGGASVRAGIDRPAAAAGWTVERSSCLGLCDRAPAALREREPCGLLSPGDAGALLAGRDGAMPGYAESRSGETRVVMARLGRLDPDSVDSARAAGAYRALETAVGAPSTAILEAVERSGLRGCGGAGFPTGRKWRMVAGVRGPEKYVVCNADESEPGAFKDRVLMDGDPHLLLEGMALTGYAVGAAEGIIYIRGEYEWLASRLERAIAQAEARGWLGARVGGRDVSFRVSVHRGAGAYICGEESALLESLEGRRGEPRSRPPYPTTRGYRGRPTVVNNVETLCHVVPIVAGGAEWFRTRGSPGSPGTKVFALSGHVARPGVIEAPLGVTLRQLVDGLGGAMLGGVPFKAALVGGAAGTFAPASQLDLPLDFTSSPGIAVGSGAVIVLNESVHMPTFLVWVLRFFEAESCGKCTPCRVGTREARAVAARLADHGARPGDRAELARLARLMRATSLCGLGQSVAWPVESALAHFGNEFGA